MQWLTRNALIAARCEDNQAGVGRESLIGKEPASGAVGTVGETVGCEGDVPVAAVVDLDPVRGFSMVIPKGAGIGRHEFRDNDRLGRPDRWVPGCEREESEQCQEPPEGNPAGDEGMANGRCHGGRVPQAIRFAMSGMGRERDGSAKGAQVFQKIAELAALEQISESFGHRGQGASSFENFRGGNLGFSRIDMDYR